MTKKVFNYQKKNSKITAVKSSDNKAKREIFMVPFDASDEELGELVDALMASSKKASMNRGNNKNNKAGMPSGKRKRLK